jgi:PAS domain S-box-containing protein
MALNVRPDHALLLTILATAAVALLRLAAAPFLGDELPLLPFTFSVVLAAWLGGFRMGLVATALGWLVGHYLFLGPGFAFGPLDSADWVRLAIFLLGNGFASWLVGAFREARRREDAERARLEKSEAFHSAIANISSDFAFEARVEPDGRVVPESVTEGFEKLFGRSVHELTSPDAVRSLFHAEDGAGMGAHVAGLLAGRTLTGEVRGIARDGRVIWLAYNNRPLRDASGRVTRIYGAARDVTREKEAEAARAAAAAEAEARAAALRESSERLQEALSVGRMIAWDYDLATGRVARSENTAALVGYDSGPLRNFYDAVHPEDLPEVQARFERAAKGDGDYECEFRIVRPDGTSLWFSDRGRLRRDAAGRPAHMTGICVDVTARKRAEEALRQREEQLRLALAAADMVGFQWDVATGRVTRIGEVPADDALGGEATVRDVVARIHPEDRPGWEARVRAALAGETDVVFSEHRERGDDGPWQWRLVHARMERARDGTPLVLTGLGIDVTPLKQMQEALREADRRKDEFLATLAHELRNPLAPLANGLQVLQMEEAVSPATRRVHEMMARQVDQMVRLVDDLLEVSRITRGQVELRKRPVSLQTVVEHAVETSRPLIEAGRHRLVLDVPEAPLWLEADAVRLAQVFSNLLNNAARYTPAGGRIELSARRTDGEVSVTVRDTGIGIAAEDLPRVFEMFVQGDRSQASGLGIGLALVRALVQLHGGHVEARSEGVGRGSEFVVRLPRAEREPATDAAAREAELAAQDPSRLRVVAVDDNHDAADALGLVLGHLGADVTVAYDGASALDAIRAQHPQLAFVDLGMPVLDGFELARRVREDDELDGVTLVALSGWGQEHDRRRSRAAGFDRHLVKPVDRAALQELLSSLR